MSAEVKSQGVIKGNCELAAQHLRDAVSGGKHWFPALLEAMGMCDVDEEVYNGRLYSYLIGGEALDWLTLAERLLQEVDGLLPEHEKSILLFEGKPPVEIPADEFKRLIGAKKHCQYLNYFYGVTVEEALIQKVRGEVRKERLGHGYRSDFENDDEIYARIYGKGRTELFHEFRRYKDYPPSRVTSLAELKEFTYWLFKYRVRQSEPARVASDTRKGLSQLKTSGFSGKPVDGRRRRVVPLETCD